MPHCVRWGPNLQWWAQLTEKLASLKALKASSTFGLGRRH